MPSAAYVAGLIDGDGCITAFLKKLKTSPHGFAVKGRVKITSKSIRLLKAVHEDFGGKIVDRGDGLFDLCWESFEEIEKLLNAILPFLIEKREQALCMLKLCSLKRSRAFYEKVELVRRIQELNSGAPTGRGVKRA